MPCTVPSDVDKTVQNKFFALWSSYSNGMWLSKGWWLFFSSLQPYPDLLLFRCFTFILMDAVLNMLVFLPLQGCKMSHKALATLPFSTAACCLSLLPFETPFFFLESWNYRLVYTIRVLFSLIFFVHYFYVWSHIFHLLCFLAMPPSEEVKPRDEGIWMLQGQKLPVKSPARQFYKWHAVAPQVYLMLFYRVINKCYLWEIIM